MKPNVKMTDGGPTKTLLALQYREIEVVLVVPAPGQECELCGRKVPKARKNG